MKFCHFLIEVLRPEVEIVYRHRNQNDHTVTNREDETIFSGIIVTCRCLTTAFTSRSRSSILRASIGFELFWIV